MPTIAGLRAQKGDEKQQRQKGDVEAVTESDANKRLSVSYSKYQEKARVKADDKTDGEREDSK